MGTHYRRLLPASLTSPRLCRLGMGGLDEPRVFSAVPPGQSLGRMGRPGTATCLSTFLHASFTASMRRRASLCQLSPAEPCEFTSSLSMVLALPESWLPAVLGGFR